MMDDDDLEEGYVRRGIILFESETVAVAALLTESGDDHVRVIWQHDVPLIWPMRLRPVEHSAVAD